MVPVSSEALSLRVRSMSWEAEGILGIELVSATPGAALPLTQAGAHVDLQLGQGLWRSYSLTHPGERHRWCIAVNHDAASRGGSRWIHETLRPGALIQAQGPRNHFALDEAAPHSVLIAGGIGITPLLAMARRLTELGRPWALHYAARTRARMAFIAELQALAGQAGASLDLRCDAEGDAALNLPALFAQLPLGAHVYACGPEGLLSAFEAAAKAWPHEQVHLERFVNAQAPATEGGFTVHLARSGRRVAVLPGQSILDALEAQGIEPLHSCRQGICGTCEAGVLRGIHDHRDHVLSDSERAQGQRMMICCSGAKTPELELDL